MAGKRYYWLKLQVGFFQELIIKQLRTLSEGDSIVLLYLKLLLTEEALDVWYALLHDLDYQILAKALQQYMLTNKFKPTVAELREIYAELVSPVISDWSEGWEKVSRAIGHYGMYQEQAAMESFDEVTREVVKRLGFQNICLSENIVADRARFAEIYQAIQRWKRTEVNVGSALPNLREMVQNRLAELAQKGQKAIEQEKDKN